MEGRFGPTGGDPAYAPGYAHLHVRSGFSYGLGTATPEELVAAAAGMGFSSLALTDRNALYGVPRFLAACAEWGLSAMVGAEISVEDRGEPCGHVVLLAESDVGRRSLSRLITAYRTRAGGATAAGRRNPRATLADLAGHADGLVCLTGAVPFGYLPSLVLGGRSREAAAGASLLREAFGGRLYAEISDDATNGSGRRMRRVEAFAQRAGLPVVAAQEATYLSPEDHRLHEVLVAASNLSALPGPGYRPTDRLHLAGPGAMARLFRDRPGALRNAARIAERCAGAVALRDPGAPRGGLRLPEARPKNGEDPAGRLLALAVAGARARYGGNRRVDARDVKGRLRRELSCVAELGMVGYFLIAREAVEIAREKGVPVTGRGSAANSLLAYCLGLTQPEPLSQRLVWERFLHEERADPPDVDLDLDSKRRDEVRDELMRRYSAPGGPGVAVATTAQTFSLRGAVRTAARAMGYAPSEVDALSRNVPRRAGSWEEALSAPQMRGHRLQDRADRRLGLVRELSWNLRGRLWQAGTHLGGLVFGTPTERLSEISPVEPSGKPGLPRVQADKDDLELLGCPKLDLLGLRMHTALAEAGELASRRLGRRVDPLSPPPNDRAAYGLIRSGQTAGLFQLESPGQMQLQRRLGARRIEDITAGISLFRPGPVRGRLTEPYVARRNAREPYSVPLPELDEVLRETYGVILYQEQVLQVCARVAGFTLAEGDAIRRAMTKDRGPGAMRGIRREFLRRAGRRGVPPEKAAEVFGWVEAFASYGFSKAHAASFAEIAYASAYMMARFPAETYAGLLNSQPMGYYSPRVLLNEARRRGLAVLPPDARLSGDGFAVEENGRALRVGMRYCRGISGAAIETVLEEREKRPFASPADLYRRTAADADHVAALVRAGFLDHLGHREALAHEALRLPKKPRKKGAHAQPELPLPHPASWWESRESRRLGELPAAGGDARAARAREQRRVLGLDVSGHPLADHRGALGSLGVTPSTEILSLAHGTRARAAGLFESLQSPPTRSGRSVRFLQVEDEAGLLQTTIFEDVHRRRGHLLYRSGAFLLEGIVEQDPRRGFSFVVDEVRDLGDAVRGAKPAKPARRRPAAERARRPA